MISKFKFLYAMVCVAITTFLLTSQFVYWRQPLDYYLPEGIDPSTYFNYQAILILLLIGAFAFYTISLIWRACVPTRIEVSRKSIRRKKENEYE